MVGLHVCGGHHALSDALERGLFVGTKLDYSMGTPDRFLEARDWNNISIFREKREAC